MAIALPTAAADVALPRARRWPAALVAGAIILGLFSVFAAVGPWVVPYDVEKFHRPRALESPSGSFLFGTDRYGRDVFSRVVVGSRSTLTMAACGTLLG